MIKHAAVIGGGFAGAAAASALAEAGVAVTLLEQKSTLGGRASSLRDGVTGEDADNGQHLFMGCYTDTRRFLKRLKVDDRLLFMPALRIPFYETSGRRADLSAAALPGALGLLAGLFRWDLLKFPHRWALARGLASIKMRRQPGLASMTVSEWLRRLRQPAEVRRAFWDPLCLAVLNERPEAACAEALEVVLRRSLLSGAEDRRLAYAGLPLSKLWAVELKNYLKSRGGQIAPGQTVLGFEAEGSRVSRMALAGGLKSEIGAVVCAVSLPAFLKLCPAEIAGDYEGLKNVSYSPIVSVNLWLKQAAFPDAWAGILEGDFQWVFNRHLLWRGHGASPGYVSLVLSAARGAPIRGEKPYDKMTHEEIVALALKDLSRIFNGKRMEIAHSSVVWEKQATPSPTPDFWKARPGVRTKLKNFFLAGDWVNSGLPPTIEAATRSGHMAARAAIDYLDAGDREEPGQC